ncbi:DUF4124 domain-containing protein [Stutzerimonas stutzeri]|uniref:DUF4124 domain-containing protein n=1 Tax=Stutzerimonas stutzeri TaxID=316 RepID=UPI001C2E3A4F|nr:DUF4124 domain-containing protein [Stutzerimonas stutzeri]
MHKLLIASSCALLLNITPTLAANVYRCTDGAGNVTFTRQGCPPDHAALSQDVTNPTPSSDRLIPLAKPRPRNARKHTAADQLTVVGVPEDGCGNRITGSAKRNAKVRQQIRPGMTRADIESTFGTPDSITSRNGQVQYRYSTDKGRTRTISFDEHGCVRGKR